MNKQTNKQRKRSPRRPSRQTNAVRFPLPFVMLLSWMRSYAGEEECSCGASPDYEIDSFVDAEGLLEADGPIEKDQMLLSALEQQRSGAFAVYQTFLACRQHALQLFTDLYGEQDAQQALSPLLLGVSNLTVTVGREITNAKSPCGTLRVSYTNATTISEVIEAHTGYAVAEIQEGNGRHRSEARLAPQVLQHVEAAHPGLRPRMSRSAGPCRARKLPFPLFGGPGRISQGYGMESGRAGCKRGRRFHEGLTKNHGFLALACLHFCYNRWAVSEGSG